MSLTLLAPMVVLGIALVVMAVHMTGGSTRAALDGEAAALRRFGDDFPETVVRSVRVTRDAGAAFLELEDGRVGIVQSVGRKFLTRIVAAEDLAGAPRASAASLAVRFRDFTWPGGVFTFGDGEEARAVEAMFAALGRQTMWEKVS